MHKDEEVKVTIDSLAMMISRLETRLVDRIDILEKEMKYRFTGVQNQLDNIYLNYTTMNEHRLLKDRMTRIERKISIREKLS